MGLASEHGVGGWFWMVILAIALIVAMLVGALPNPVAPVEMEEVTATIIDKRIKKGITPWIFPIAWTRREFEMDNGDVITVSSKAYSLYDIGDTYTYERMVKK